MKYFHRFLRGFEVVAMPIFYPERVCVAVFARNVIVNGLVYKQKSDESGRCLVGNTLSNVRCFLTEMG